MARSPFRDGWQVLRRAPEAVLGEIVWRWAFGATLWVVLVLSFRTFFAHIEISRAEFDAIKALEPFSWVAITVRVIRATVHGLRAMGPVLIPALSILWIAMATVGRVGTLRALAGEGARTNWLSAAALNTFRLMISCAAFLAFFGAGVLVNRVVDSGNDFGLAFFLMLIAVLLLSIVWGAVNWFLSTAAIFAVKDGAGIRDSLDGAAGFCTDSVARVSIWFGLMRTGLLVFVSAVSLVMLGGIVGGQWRGPLIGLVAITLVYFALADFLYIWRLAVYIGLTEPEPLVIERVSPTTEPAPQEVLPRSGETVPVPEPEPSAESVEAEWKPIAEN